MTVTRREAVAATMLVLREPGEVYALRHTAGPRRGLVGGADRPGHARDRRPLARSRRRARPGPAASPRTRTDRCTWCSARTRTGSTPTCTCVASTRRSRGQAVQQLRDPARRPSRHEGLRRRAARATIPSTHEYEPAELLVLEPERLEVVARLALPEAVDRATVGRRRRPSTWSAPSHLYRVHWDGAARCTLDDDFTVRYRTIEGQTYGWDCVIALGAVWFLDNGFGSERYAGTFRGQGVNPAPLHLVRVDLATASGHAHRDLRAAERCRREPAARRRARGASSWASTAATACVAAFDIAADGARSRRWQREQNHACHMLLFADTGELVTTDHDASRMVDDIVVLDIETGDERVRVASGSPLQSVVFPAAGLGP